MPSTRFFFLSLFPPWIKPRANRASSWLSAVHMIPDVKQYLAHHRASEIDSCAVGLGVNLSCSHWLGATYLEMRCAVVSVAAWRERGGFPTRKAISNDGFVDLNEQGGLTEDNLTVFQPGMSSGLSMGWFGFKIYKILRFHAFSDAAEGWRRAWVQH